MGAWVDSDHVQLSYAARQQAAHAQAARAGNPGPPRRETAGAGDARRLAAASPDRLNVARRAAELARGQTAATANAEGVAGKHATAESGFQPFGEDGFTFRDLIDVVNPLQHIPVVSSIYRAITGDTLDPAARIAGDTLFFGPVGAAAAAVNVAITETTGKDLGGHALAFLEGDEAPAATLGADGTAAVASAAAGAPAVRPAGTAAEPTATGALPPDGDILDPDAAVTFGRSATGFAPQAIPVEALPPDILAALYGGGPVRPLPPEESAFLAERTAADSGNADPQPKWRDLYHLEPAASAGGEGAAPSAASVTEESPATDPVSRTAGANSADAAGSPPGTGAAIAADGGWLSSTMLDALERYREGARLGHPGTPEPVLSDMTR